jgi:hypothetical protein
MSAVIDPLVRDLVTWCARFPRSYLEVLDAWRTSCPRLMVWEEAVARGLLETRATETGLIVAVTPAGRALADPATAPRAPSAAPAPPALRPVA